MTTLNDLKEKTAARIDWRIAGGYLLASLLLALLLCVNN